MTFYEGIISNAEPQDGTVRDSLRYGGRPEVMNQPVVLMIKRLLCLHVFLWSRR